MGEPTVSYKQSGVSIDANAAWVRKIHSAMAGTHGPRVLGAAGAFAGMFRLDEDRKPSGKHRRPVLVGCTDGVGTKVLLGIKARRLHGLGIDLVAMNVNDLITCGAEPLFFLDYIAVHKLVPDTLLAVVEGIADGCRRAGCALLGGETAEMPDLYRKGGFDLAGFALGLVDDHPSIRKTQVSPGDILIGLPSSGVHSNGFSLVRKLIAKHKLRLNRHIDELGESPADALLRPTRIYVRSVLSLLGSYRGKGIVTGMAHITGGGLPGNVARILGANCDAVIETNRWTPPPVFAFLEGLGVKRDEMFRVFNMGIGYVLIVRPRFTNGVERRLTDLGASPIVIGRVKRGAGNVILRPLARSVFSAP